MISLSLISCGQGVAWLVSGICILPILEVRHKYYSHDSTGSNIRARRLQQNVRNTCSSQHKGFLCSEAGSSYCSGVCRDSTEAPTPPRHMEDNFGALFAGLLLYFNSGSNRGPLAVSLINQKAGPSAKTDFARVQNRVKRIRIHCSQVSFFFAGGKQGFALAEHFFPSS